MDSPLDDPSTRTGPLPFPSSVSEAMDALGSLDLALLDDQRLAEQIERLLSSFSPNDLALGIRQRLHDLNGSMGEIVLRLIEVLGDQRLCEALAEALVDQPELTPERTWDALALLEGTGQIDRWPELVERRLDLLELLEEDGDGEASLQGLVEQLEDDPEEVWVALQGLSAIEPDVRVEIVSGLGRGFAEQPLGPGLAEFLRLLAYADDPGLQTAAIEALALGRPLDLEGDLTGEDHRSSAWADLAEHHPDPDVVQRAWAWLDLASGPSPLAQVQGGLPALSRQAAPRLLDGLVTALDEEGRGSIALVVEDRGERVTAAFVCDVLRGVSEVVGQVDSLESLQNREGGDLRAELLARPDLDVLEEVPELAVGLLAGALGLRGPESPPTLRHWVERTLGPSFHPQPFAGLVAALENGNGWDPASLPFEEMPERSQRVLDACPSWVDRSDLTQQIAEELLLRDPGASPDPRRDAGAYRYLFEHRLHDRLELYRRMLSWMGWFWQAAGDVELSRSALGLAWQLCDPQHVVPAHPFTVELTTRSLIEAQEALRWGRE